MNKISDTEKLKEIAQKIRKDILISLNAAGSGHLGGSLGLADIFTCLYFSILNHKATEPYWKNRDRVILSIGHVAPVIYTTLAHAAYFPKEELITLRKLGSRLQGHPSKGFGLPGIEISSGSLGQGLSVSVGLAISAKIDKKSHHIFTILGDGELQEGSVWEAAMSASHYHLSNLIAIVDRNYCQIDGQTESVMGLEPLKQKWESFGWNVIEADGNNIPEIIAAFNSLPSNNKPTVIIFHTKMGKGIKSIEGDYRWHGKVPNNEQLTQFLSELERHG